MELDELLRKARIRYPVGTKFKIVHMPKHIVEVKNHDPYPVHDENYINFYINKPLLDCEGACVYQYGKWAEIISLPETKTVKVNKKDNYIINLFKKLKIK